ncbi:discoidin domain-containing protein [Psychrosphaera haliotis]|uniref:Uncharacterized protein n=1 Tax=Psychrosphaera haliotis TaxID=555083 RepID=A0A6N8F7I8_9GAMM|nr:discoidin domain-containing protein [Psychrosphaera haliotis]MUH71369.1 hypothetical protein [Psychrosphaera haliotis]
MLRRIIRKFATKKVAEPKDSFDEKAFIDELPLAIAKVKQHIEHNPITNIGGKANNDPLTVNTNRKGRFVRLSLQTQKSFHLDTIEIYNKDGRNIAKNKKTIISSCYNDETKYNGEGALTGKKNGGANFHTKRDNAPWLIIDLTTIRKLDKVVIYNRGGECASRAFSLMIEVSTDLKKWHTIFDNWQAIKTYNKGDINPTEKALLYGAILEGAPANKLLKELKGGQHMNAATKLHGAINELVAPRGVALGPHGFMKTFALSSDARINNILKSLSKVLMLLTNEFGVKAFISSGTLLGVVRDGKLIPHDDDVDICYISQFSTEAEILKEREDMVQFLVSKGYHLKPSGIAHYWCTTPEGVNLDIFSGFIENERACMNPLARGGVGKDDVLPLQTKQVNGYDLLLPANPESLLQLNYGDSWKVPDPLWTFNWSKSKAEYKFLYF